MEAAKTFLEQSLAQGKIEIPSTELSAFFGKLRDFEAPPVTFLIETQSVRGNAKKDHVELVYNFNIRVLGTGTDDHWVKVPLLSEQFTVSEFAVEDGPKDDNTTFGIVSGKHTLMTRKTGLFKIRMNGVRSFTSDKNCGVKIDMPSCSCTSLHFTVASPQLDIAVSPCVARTLNSTETATEVVCSLPHTNEVNVQWTAKQVEPTEEDTQTRKKAELVVTTTQNTLFSIGEGVCSAATVWDFRIMHGTRSDFQIRLDPRLRVLEVTADGLKRWEVTTADAPSPAVAAAAAASLGALSADAIAVAVPGAPVYAAPVPAAAVQALASTGGPQILRVWLDRAVEGSWTLMCTTEFEMGGTSAEVRLPEFSVVGVNKEIGFIGVEARTSVEIADKRFLGVAKIDVRELPEEVSRHASRPVLHAFKFLVPRYAIDLDVKKHDDVDVLIAVADQGWFEVIVAEDRVLTRCVLKIRNTQRQYVRCQLPNTNCDVWSVVVAGKPTKPSLDKDGRVLLPLEKSGSGEQQSFTVEFVYLMPGQKFGGNGHIVANLPKFDMPINHAFASLYLPKDLKYKNIKANMETVEYFTGTQPDTQVVTMPTIGGMAYNMRSQVQSNVLYRADSVRGGDDSVSEDERESPKSKKLVSSNFGRPSGRGVVPVTVSVPKIGREFRFERLLVIEDAITISADYKRGACGCCMGASAAE